MSLILPPWGFQFGVSSNTGTPGTTPGVNFTAGASNADGTAVEVLGNLAFDCHYLVVGIGGLNLTGVDVQVLLDVLTDPTGGTSYGAFIDDLVCGMTPIAGTTIGIGCWYHFPVYIPAESAIAVMARTSHTVDVTTGRVIMYAYGHPSRPEMWWCGQKVESLGINAASSKGTNVTPGNTGVDGAWTTIGTSAARYGAVQYGINGSDATSISAAYFWEIGVGSVALPGAPKSYRSMGTAESGAASGLSQIIGCDVAAGTDWQLRATCSATAEVYNAAIYGVY